MIGDNELEFLQAIIVGGLIALGFLGVVLWLLGFDFSLFLKGVTKCV